MTKNIHKILLIEQDSASVSSIQKMLLFWRYITTVSYSLAEALEIMKKEKFDLLLVAYVISDKKDFYYLDVIKKELNTTSTPILLVDNERTNTTLKDECKRIDLGTFITKPIRQTNLFKNLISIDKDLAISIKPSPSPVKIKYRHKVLSHNKYSVLIAEDNKLNLKLIKTILLQLLPHACIDSAANGIIAKDRATIRPYDIIFMDLQMPEMDGITSTKLIIKELKSNTPPIIALTANATQEDKEMCYKSGMIGFLTKPIIKDNLIKILNSNILRK
jgi:CheY-like chemotaxis protein